MTLEVQTVDGIPVGYVRPSSDVDRHQIALFLPYLGGSKRAVSPQLIHLAARGFTAISFDPWRLGDRNPASEMAAVQALADYRHNMWPMLGQSTLDALHVLDWATQQFDVHTLDIVAGGLSMGGDVAVALAGSDQRVTRVAAIAATPDWTRPGMRRLDDPADIIDQGQSGFYGTWLYEHLDPMTHAHRYAHGPAIAFELGAKDTHVPPTAAFAFRDLVHQIAPAAAAQIRLSTHNNLGHLDVLQAQKPLSRALDWMTAT